MKNIKRKGFTLVELLIVIVVIGILSAMMMLSSTEAVTSARASNIVSNLRNFKTAAMAMYVDNYDKMDRGTKPDNDHALLIRYMNKSESTAASEADTSKYTLEVESTRGEWYVKFSGATDQRVRDKLAGRAKSVGLLKAMNVASENAYDGTGSDVFMFVTSFDVSAISNN